jgi:RHS repeat-associated protein
VTSVTLGGSTTTMEYDHTGMRVKKYGAGGLTLYPFQGYEIAPNGEVTKFIRIGVENFASKKGTVRYFYHNDHLGSVNVVTDENGNRVQLNEYDPWGGVSRSEGTIDPTHRFTGKELDPETGLYYYGGRYYDPEISRFISPDPFVQSPENPQNLNRYSYVINNPQRFIDPSGYGFWSSIFGFFKKIFTKFIMPVLAPGLYLMNKLISSIPENVRNGFEIFGGIAMMLNPATFVPGLLFTISGGLGYCKNSGCQIASSVFGAMGAVSSGGGGGGGSGGGGPGNDSLGSVIGGLMLVNAVGGRGKDVRGKPHQLPTCAFYCYDFYLRGVDPLRPNTVQIPFSSLDNGVQPEDMSGFDFRAQVMLPGTSLQIDESMVFTQFNAGFYSSGRSTIGLEGMMTKDLNGNVSFVGRVFGVNEWYNFDKPGLGNLIGYYGPGRPFWIEYVGSRAVTYPR